MSEGTPQERAAAFFAEVPEFEGTMDEALAAASEASKIAMAEKWGEPLTPEALRVSDRERIADAFDLLVHVCPLHKPIGLTNRELAVSAMSAALASEDADLVDRVAEAVRFAGQDWLLR